MRSDSQPQNWRLMKAHDSITDSISAPVVAFMPRSPHSAIRCAVGMAIGTQHRKDATASNANTPLAGRSSTRLDRRGKPGAVAMSGDGGGGLRIRAASGMITVAIT